MADNEGAIYMEIMPEIRPLVEALTERAFKEMFQNREMKTIGPMIWTSAEGPTGQTHHSQLFVSIRHPSLNKPDDPKELHEILVRYLKELTADAKAQ